MYFLSRHLHAFYEQYAEDNELTLTETQQRISNWDKRQWKAAVKEVYNKDWPEDAKQRLELLAYSGGFNKTKLMTSLAILALISMTAQQQHTIAKRIAKDGYDEAKRMDGAFTLSKVKAKKAYSIVTQNETREIWSDNLWINSDSLASDIEILVNKHLRHGIDLRDLETLLTQHDNPKQFKPYTTFWQQMDKSAFNARRIVRTESSRLIDEVNMTTYRQAGVKYVDWVTEAGACQMCVALEEGGPYAINDAPDIPGSSHPNCRCHKTPADNPNSELITFPKEYGN